MSKILLYGGGGRCRETIGILIDLGLKHSSMHVVDQKFQPGQSVSGVNVLGNSVPDTSVWGYTPAEAICCVGGLMEMRSRERAYNDLLSGGWKMKSVIAKSADVGGFYKPGVLVGRNASVGASALLEEGCTINTGAVVSHDCSIGAFAHIAPGAILAGGVVVGDRAIVGMGCTVYAGITIGEDAIVANGAHVFADVPAGKTVPVGKPWV